MLRLFKQNYPIRNIFFVLIEGAAIYASVLLASFCFRGSELFWLDPYLSYKALLITFVFLLCLYYNDLYDFKVVNDFTELGIRLLQSLGVSSIFLSGIYYLIPTITLGQGIFTLCLVFNIVLIVAWRFVYSMILKWGLFDQKIILIGSGELAQKIYTEINEKLDCGFKISLIIFDPSGEFDVSEEDKPNVVKSMENFDLLNKSKELNVDKIVVALKEKRGTFPTDTLLDCRVAGIEIVEGNSFYEMLSGKLDVTYINPAWLIFSEGFKKPVLRSYVKRLEDIVFALFFLVVFSPIALIAAICIKLDSKGPVLFSQERVGKNKKPYMVHKFRSMVTDAEKDGKPVWAKKNDDRVTRVGRFIRKTRIDEIPQLWNVLKGEMSFIGPRPEREYFVKQLEAEIPYYKERFTIKPGLTGWAQVCYGYGETVEDAVEKLNYELFYIKNFSIFMDFVVVVRTVKTVIFKMGQ